MIESEVFVTSLYSVHASSVKVRVSFPKIILYRGVESFITAKDTEVDRRYGR